MALNRFMHLRNIYRTPPDFAKLSKTSEEFGSIAKLDVTGKVTIDFKDPHALRVLTRCLLKADFGLDVVIPENRLVPTLPLRLNYILWIEDLMVAINRKDNIQGLDIGTGACAIYPLLAAAKNKWQMLGTETDQQSFVKAQENVERNNLQDLVKLSKNPTKTLFEYLFSDENVGSFDFCMCNPPFYSNVQELCDSRSPARLPPKNAFTGSPQELITEGGEVTFCRKMIKESKAFRNKVLIFTTMVGHKYNLKELTQDLKAEGIEHTTTEFCQGRVTRWGLAWTFQHFEISKLVPGRDKPRKKNVPVIYLLPELPGIPYNFENASKKLLDLLQDLKINYKVLHKRGNHLSLDITASENTWSNQRRKRRMMKLQQPDAAKKPKLDKIAESIASSNKANDLATNSASNNSKLEIEKTSDSNTKNKASNGSSDTTIGQEDSRVAGVCHEKPTSSTDLFYTVQTNDHTDCASEYLGVNISAEEEYLVHALLKILQKDKDIVLEIEFLDGKSGKEGVHQILQYIKNNWKYV